MIRPPASGLRIEGRASGSIEVSRGAPSITSGSSSTLNTESISIEVSSRSIITAYRLVSSVDDVLARPIIVGVFDGVHLMRRAN